MGQPILVQSGWSRMVRDASRDQLDGDSLWNMVDWIPNIGAPARMRGPWAYANAQVYDGPVTNLFYADFSAGGQLIAITQIAGPLYSLWGGTTNKGSIGAHSSPGSPVLFNDLVILCGAGAKKYDGTAAPAALGGSPPAQAVFVETYKGRVILANDMTASNAGDRKVYFSAVGNQDSWDTTNAWIQATYPLTGIAALRGAILLFSKGKTERIRGDSPPPSLGMILEPAFDVGCTDARSIAKFDDKVVFANPGGVYLTDGATPRDLTALGGIKTYWRSLMSGYTAPAYTPTGAFPNNWSIAGGIYKRKYVVTVRDGSGTLIVTLVCDLDSNSWYRLGNINSASFARQLSSDEELYFALGDASKRVAKLADALSPAQVVLRQDADGTNIFPVAESGFIRPRPYTRATRYLPPGTSKRAKNVYLSADIRGNTGQNPALSVGYLLDPAASAYTTIGSFPSTDWQSALAGLKRKRFAVSQVSQGFAFKLALAGGQLMSADLYDMELEFRFREASRR